MATLLILLVSAGPAAAHPFGDPQTLEISRDASTVSMRWKAAADDLTWLALRLNVLDGRRSYIYKDGVQVPEQSDRSDAEVLARAPEFAAYLLERIGVRQEGVDCTGEVAPVQDLLADGAVVDFTCPEPVAEVEVRVQMLTDLHAAYRTLATGPGGATHIYDTDSETHTFGADETDTRVASTAGREGLTLVAWAGGGAVGLAAVFLVLRRARRHPA